MRGLFYGAVVLLELRWCVAQSPTPTLSGPPCGGYVTLTNTQIFGGPADIGVGFSSSSFAACAASCCAVGNCAQFAYESGGCWLIQATGYTGIFASTWFTSGQYPSRMATPTSSGSASGSSSALFTPAPLSASPTHFNATTQPSASLGPTTFTTVNFTASVSAPAYQFYTVPPGASLLQVYLWGAGGGGSEGQGGAGAYVSGLLPVAPGETLRIIVGVGGQNANTALPDEAGSGGGGAVGYDNGGSGGGGGGRSAIQVFSLGAWSDSVTAGGGGGAAGWCMYGGHASWSGTAYRGDGSRSSSGFSMDQLCAPCCGPIPAGGAGSPSIPGSGNGGEGGSAGGGGTAGFWENNGGGGGGGGILWRRRRGRGSRRRWVILHYAAR